MHPTAKFDPEYLSHYKHEPQKCPIRCILDIKCSTVFSLKHRNNTGILQKWPRVGRKWWAPVSRRRIVEVTTVPAGIELDRGRYDGRREEKCQEAQKGYKGDMVSGHLTRQLCQIITGLIHEARQMLHLMFCT